MPDPIFAHPRLAAVYDDLELDRDDLDAYTAMVEEFGAQSVLDIGCGTGTFACLLAQRGIRVTAVDPAAASLDVARGKPGADAVQWVAGDVTALPPLQVDMAVMTGNVAQVFTTDEDWSILLQRVHASLRTGGRLVFETRVPGLRAWENWTRQRTHSVVHVPGIGDVERWCEVLYVALPLVTFAWTYVFASDGARIVSESTLRFRDRDEISERLSAEGFTVDAVRDAPDRPGREYVFVASRD